MNNRLDNIQNLLNQCNYIAKTQVYNTCQRVLSRHPQMAPQLIPCYDNLGTTTCLELKGGLEIPFKDRQYTVVTSIMFPSKFPHQCPVYKLENLDPQRFDVNEVYRNGIQQDQKTVIIFNNFAQVSNDILTHLDMLKQKLSDNFPFYQKRKNTVPNVGTNTNINTNMVQKRNTNPNIYNPSMMPNKSEVKINSTIQRNLMQIMNNLNTDVIELQTSEIDAFDKLTEIEKKESQLHLAKTTLNANINKADYEIDKLGEFVHQNEDRVLNKDNIDQFLYETDEFSKQMIEITSEKKAIRDSYYFIENAFKKNKIDFETTLELTRNFASMEFKILQILKKSQRLLEEQNN